MIRRCRWLAALLPFAAGVLPAAPLHAQGTGTVAGRVTDERTGVSVFADANLLRVARTDATGRYRLTDVPVGARSLNFRQIGYASKVVAVTIVTGQTATVNAALASRPMDLDAVVVTGQGGEISKRRIATTVDEYPAGQNPFQVSTAKADCDPGLDKLPIDQLTAYREPGRVNLNTVTSDDVWNAVVAGPLVQTGTTTPDPVRDRSAANFAADPAKTTAALLSLSGTGTLIVTDTNAAIASGTAFNPVHSIYTITRLANSATIRSNVFAVWITLRESIQNDPDSVKYHRAFYIVDRSIPVAHEAGKDHNVWDSVILRRIIE